MEQKKGIEETKQLVSAVLALVKVSAELLKDGAQVSDLVEGFKKLEGDVEKKALLEAALKDIKEVPEELKDLSLVEGLELGVHVIKEVPSLIAAFKK